MKQRQLNEMKRILFKMKAKRDIGDVLTLKDEFLVFEQKTKNLSDYYMFVSMAERNKELNQRGLKRWNEVSHLNEQQERKELKQTLIKWLSSSDVKNRQRLFLHLLHDVLENKENRG